MIAISDNIRLRIWNLSPEEEKIMKTHCDIGANTLREIYSYNESNEFIRLAINIAGYHHENWDGSGYPNRISGKTIPLCARIVSIINEYDLYVSERSYKTAYSHEEGMRMINENAGIRFDPDIVNVFNKIQNQLKK
jgi:putative two-component system response regulator